jgi:glycosyltransferase involved in cell wall biosynthesis
MAAWLLTAGDRGGTHPLYNTDHLFELWDEIHSRLPRTRLWLVGQPSNGVRRRCAGRDDVVLLGRMSQPEVHAHIANFDVGLYPRRVDHAPFPLKLAEYMALGVPTVSYDLELSQRLRDTGAGLLADSPRQFVDAVERLAVDEALRHRLGAAAREAGASLNWDPLLERYQREVLDAHLPPDG